MPVKKSDINILSSYVSRVPAENRPVVEQAIQLYKERQIVKFVTAQNIQSKIATRNKKKIDEAKKALSQYHYEPPVVENLVDKITERRNKKIVAANKISTKFRNRLILEITQKESAFQNYLQDVTINIASASRYREKQFYRCVSDITKKAFQTMTADNFAFVVDVKVTGGNDTRGGTSDFKFRKTDLIKANLTEL